MTWLLCCFSPTELHSAVAASRETSLVLAGARIFDGTGAPASEGIILVRGERIAAIGPAERIAVPDDARVIDLSGYWIIPGLIDAHVHFFQSGSLYTRPDVIDLRRFWPYNREIAWIRARLPATLTRYLASGITSVIDLAGPEWVLEVRQLAQQTPHAPRVRVAGPGLAPLLPPPLTGQHAPAVIVGNAEEARREVVRLASRRPDLIKIWFAPTPAMNLDRQFAWIEAAVEESRTLGLRVAAHATELELARRMVQAGVDVLVHSVDDKAVDDAFVDLLKQRGVIYVTTLGVSEGYRETLGQKPRLNAIEHRLGDPAVIDSLDDLLTRFPRYRPPPLPADNRIALHNLARLHAAGVTVAAGSDAGNIGTLHGPALHGELALMAEAGLSPRDILVAATRNGAMVAGLQQKLGTLEVGKLADMLVLSADPLEDIRHTRRIAAIIKGGVIYQSEQLMRQLQTPPESRASPSRGDRSP
jgi:imidazolonepropionase-like amidohydrolase